MGSVVASRRAGPIAGGLTSLVLAACAAGVSTTPSATGAAQASIAPSATRSADAATGRATPSASPTPACTNPEGGVCLNTVKAGTYTTAELVPQLTYTVPDAWQNLEDTPGNFLLVAPGYSLEGVNAGGSDFIGVYTSVRAENRKCGSEQEASSDEPNVAHTPAAMAKEFQNRPGVVATKPKAVSIGGLSGLVMDLRMAADWKGTCFFAQSPYVQLIGGAPPSSLDHGLGPGLTMRLYLLARGDTTLAIEVDDFAEGAHLDGYSKIVETMQLER